MIYFIILLCFDMTYCSSEFGEGTDVKKDESELFVSFDPTNEAKKKILSDWHRLAVREGVVPAIRALRDENIRAVMVPEDDWRCLIAQLNKMNRRYSLVGWLLLIFLSIVLGALFCVLFSMYKRGYFFSQSDDTCVNNYNYWNNNRECYGCLDSESEGLLRIKKTNKLYLSKSLEGMNSP